MSFIYINDNIGLCLCSDLGVYIKNRKSVISMGILGKKSGSWLFKNGNAGFILSKEKGNMVAYARLGSCLTYIATSVSSD